MKLPAKPISSPGRAENYPPPLMRFLRSSTGSKSRGRSRSSPMFVRKKDIETQEPSSPKVTCMGQVRVRRSKTRPGNFNHRRNALFRRRFAGKLKPKFSKPDLRKWVMFFHCGFNRKGKIGEPSGKIEPKFNNPSEEIKDERKSAVARDYFSAAFSPPKNALLLTRSRSAPYRSSSLAFRFWGSPLSNEEEKSTGEDEIPPPPGSEIICKEMKLEAESEEIERQMNSISENEENPSKVENLVHPLILTRSKSEPTRIAEALEPELTFLKKHRRLSAT